MSFNTQSLEYEYAWWGYCCKWYVHIEKWKQALKIRVFIYQRRPWCLWLPNKMDDKMQRLFNLQKHCKWKITNPLVKTPERGLKMSVVIAGGLICYSYMQSTGNTCEGGPCNVGIGDRISSLLFVHWHQDWWCSLWAELQRWYFIEIMHMSYFSPGKIQMTYKISQSI